MFAMCDPSDILATSFLNHEDTGAEQIFLLDNHPGGVGIARLGYDIVGQLWDRMRGIMISCNCRDGCPRCVESPTRFNEDTTADKRSAIRLLNLMLSRSQGSSRSGQSRKA